MDSGRDLRMVKIGDGYGGLSLIFVSLLLLSLCLIVEFTGLPAEDISEYSKGCEDCYGQDCSKH